MNGKIKNKMGKARLEELKASNERVGYEWFKITEERDMCPICGGKLFSTTSHHLVMDGNTVYHCDQEDDHTFWRNARDTGDVLYLNEMANESNFDYEVEYTKNESGIWEATETKTYTMAEIKAAIKKCPVSEIPVHNSNRVLKNMSIEEFIFQLKIISKRKNVSA